MQNFMGKFNFGNDKVLFTCVIVFIIIAGVFLSTNNQILNNSVKVDSLAVDTVSSTVDTVLLAIDTVKIDSIYTDTIK